MAWRLGAGQVVAKVLTSVLAQAYMPYRDLCAASTRDETVKMRHAMLCDSFATLFRRISSFTSSGEKADLMRVELIFFHYGCEPSRCFGTQVSRRLKRYKC
jgi:hypothetical protein